MKNPFHNKQMLALSWKQPYGYLMLPPHNKKETRTWATNYRGLVLMCASKKSYGLDSILNISGSKQYRRIIDICVDDENYSERTNGQAFAVGRLVDCRPMTRIDEETTFVQYRNPWKEERISKTTGKKKIVTVSLWVHTYEEVQPIIPFHFKGAQKWKKVDQDIVNAIKLKK